MKKISALAMILGTSFLFFASIEMGDCRQPFGPPMVPAGPMLGPVVPPPGYGPFSQPFFMKPPCLPPNPCKFLSFEGGGSGFYSGNSFKIIWDGRGDIDFIRDLNFSQNTLVAEVYAALRVVPTLALTFSYMIPREDTGQGTLPADLTVGNTVFTARTPVKLKSNTSLYRLEGEYFLAVGCNYRIGGLLIGEMWVENLTANSDSAQDSEYLQEFLMGAGGTGEYAPANGIFLKFKGAYTFLQKTNGLYLDCQGRFFPEFNGGRGGSQMRFYVSGGYRFRSSEWLYNVDRKIQAVSQGPYVELGVIF